jgi:6-pyruvoyl-tetrahydropterin synthase
VYEVGTAVEVRAFHLMPGMEGPEGERHSHDYKVEVVVERAELDEQSMVCDLDTLEAALLETAGKVRDDDVEVLRPRGSSEAATVEVFAKWVHAAIAEPARRAGGQVLAVRVWESPVAFGGFRAAVG